MILYYSIWIRGTITNPSEVCSIKKETYEPCLESIRPFWHTHNDRTSRSASSWRCACPFYSSRAGCFAIASHHPDLSAPLQPRFGSLSLLVFPKAKIAVEREDICECDSHTAHKLSQWHLTADWLAPQESDCSQRHSKVSSEWLPSYIKVTQLVLKIFKMDRYIPERSHMLNLIPLSICSVSKQIISFCFNYILLIVLYILSFQILSFKFFILSICCITAKMIFCISWWQY
jgi:hypothetical protein